MCCCFRLTAPNRSFESTEMLSLRCYSSEGSLLQRRGLVWLITSPRAYSGIEWAVRRVLSCVSDNLWWQGMKIDTSFRFWTEVSVETRCYGVWGVLSKTGRFHSNYLANHLFESPTARNLSNLKQIKQILMAKIIKIWQILNRFVGFGYAELKVLPKRHFLILFAE